MGNAKTKRAVEIQDAIRQVLFRDWDPIGVNDNPNLQDEYDSYIAPLYRILVGSRSKQEIVSFLQRTERDIVGDIYASAEGLQPVVRKLLALDVKL